MSGTVDVNNPRAYPIPLERMKQAAETTLSHSGREGECGLTIFVADGEALRALNRQHRGLDAPADVLSFAADSLPAAIPSERRYLGDVLIAYDQVAETASAASQDRDNALCLLAIHGVLHLLGYDHDTAGAQERMWAAQARALSALGIDPALADSYAEASHD